MEVSLGFRSGCVLLVVLAACNALTGVGSLGVTNKDGGAFDGDDGGRGRPDPDPTDPDSPPSGRGSDAAPGGSTDAGFEASAEPPDFEDSFTRADGTLIGNGWVEKNDFFSLVNGGVVQNDTGDFTNFLVWRPASEPALNVEVSVDVTYGGTVDPDPSLFVRLQPSSEAQNEIDAYTFYTWENKTAVIDRLDPNTGYQTLASGNLSPPPSAGQTYRLFFRVIGDNPVNLEGSVLKPDGTVVASFQTSDASPKRIASPGRIGFGSGKARGTRWDNFTRVDLN
jgi:hypothetical protein